MIVENVATMPERPPSRPRNVDLNQKGFSGCPSPSYLCFSGRSSGRIILGVLGSIKFP